MQVQQSDSGSFHCNWISCIALGSGRDLLCGSSNQKTVYPLTVALKYVVFPQTRWGLMLSFTDTVIQGSQRRRKVGPFSACSTSHSRRPPFPPCQRDGRLERVNLSIVCSPPPKSMVPCLPSALDGVVSVLANQKWQQCSYQCSAQRVDRKVFV